MLRGTSSLPISRSKIKLTYLLSILNNLSISLMSIDAEILN